MSSVRVKLKSRAVVALLTGPEVEADLDRRAKAIAAAAGEGYEGGVDHGDRRSRGFVVTATAEAVRDNARNNTLLRSLDAGR